MAKKKKQISTLKKEKLSRAELEKLKILAETDKVKDEQLFVSKSGRLQARKELKSFALDNFDDPGKKFEVYYNGINKLLRKYLPKGKEYKKARSYIYEEKNVYLTRGKRIDKYGIRGADGRMGYIIDAQEILKLVMDWIVSVGTPVELFNIFRELNIDKGYGVRKEY